MLVGSAALVALSSVPLLAKQPLNTNRPALPQKPEWDDQGTTIDVQLTAKERPRRLHPAGPELPFWTYSEDPLPIIRVPKGARLRTHFTNELDEHTSIHWHGIRLPNEMDGVPFVTQKPVFKGENHLYDFRLPDTGFFPFHSHCNTIEQLGRGLGGGLLVTGDETQPYDHDVICILKDWRIGDDGSFTNFFSNSGASRAGTFGTVRTTNLKNQPTLDVPANGDVRVRLMSLDPSRIGQIGIEGHNGAALIATDGQGLSPVPFKTWRLGPAMRIDIVIRTPESGKTVTLYDYFAAEPVPLAHFKSVGPALKRRDFDPAPLFAPEISEPDLSDAIHRRIDFSATATPSYAELPPELRAAYADSLCLADKTFWAINKKTWPENGHKQLPAPLLNLQKGRTYVFELVNQTPHMHPIHIHGHTFLYLRSNKSSLPKHFTDTVLIKPKERVHVAFVADNPGDWMFHCHIIEHQDTGMMNILRVA